MAQADCAATTIAVHRGTWSNPEVAAMLAPPVTVSSMPFVRPVEKWRPGRPEGARATPPVGKHQRPTR
jgi:hypothetical protein